MDKLIIKINDTGCIKGVLTTSNIIKTKLNENCALKGKISPAPEIKGKISDVGNVKYKAYICSSDSAPIYTGTYQITPRVNAQSLQTANRLLQRDVLVEEIPYFETSNEYGDTVYIG
jgi:hypothetical protein